MFAQEMPALVPGLGERGSLDDPEGAIEGREINEGEEAQEGDERVSKGREIIFFRSLEGLS